MDSHAPLNEMGIFLAMLESINGDPDLHQTLYRKYRYHPIATIVSTLVSYSEFFDTLRL